MSYSGALVPLCVTKTFRALLSNGAAHLILLMQQFRNVDLSV
jgi:hypothetical protein